MKVSVTVFRSDEWVAAKRLETGSNVPESIVVAVDAADLSVDARRILLEAGGRSYPSQFRGHFHRNGDWSSEWSYGQMKVLCDSDSPTVEQIDMAIQKCHAELLSYREQFLKERAEEAAKEEAARLAKEENARKMAEARELLKTELAAKTVLEQQVDTLSNFLSEIPQDSLRGTLKRLAHSQEAIDDLKDEIEGASPRVYIFKDECEE